MLHFQVLTPSIGLMSAPANPLSMRTIRDPGLTHSECRLPTSDDGVSHSPHFNGQESLGKSALRE
jgi:hypothetical protein